MGVFDGQLGCSTFLGAHCGHGIFPCATQVAQVRKSVSALTSMKPKALQSGQGTVEAPLQVEHEGEAGAGGDAGLLGVEAAVARNLGGRRWQV